MHEGGYGEDGATATEGTEDETDDDPEGHDQEGHDRGRCQRELVNGRAAFAAPSAKESSTSTARYPRVIRNEVAIEAR